MQVFLLVSLISSLIGAICGIGGGIIIKPVLDALGVLDVASISFLSGCTVLAMSLYSVVSLSIKGNARLDLRISSFLAIGAAIGGVAGQAVFQLLWQRFVDKRTPSLIQSICLLVVTVGVFAYMVFKQRIRTRAFASSAFAMAIGAILGLLSSFLGIGGGPLNLIILIYFFSMETKTATENSLYIILISQVTALLSRIVSGTVPKVAFALIALMIAGAVAGGALGRFVKARIESRTVEWLFMGTLVAIMVICAKNIYSFAS